MFIPTLALFLLPPCATSEGQSIAVMLVVFSTFICSLIAQLALRSRCCGGIIIIGILAPLFRLTIGSLAGFNRCHQQSSREEGDYCPHCLPFEVGGGAHQQLLPHKSRAGDQEFTRYARIAVPTASNNPMVIWSGGSSSAWAYTELGKHERGALISLGVIAVSIHWCKAAPTADSLGIVPSNVRSCGA
jgi:hypothetical protein